VVTSCSSPSIAEVSAPLLSVEDLRVELPVDGVLYPAVDGVSLALEAGRALAVVGESGSGKTQLLRAILGLQPDGARRSGRVLCSGRDLSTLSDREWRAVRGREIGMVFQEPAAALDPVQTVGAQVVEAIRLHRPVSRAKARRRAVDALAEVAFPDPERALREYPHRLSGGLRQRACLAIALAAEPKVLLADEPTASLDATVAMQILELLDRLRRERDLAVLLVTHDLGVVARHCDRVLVLYAGRVVEEGDTAALLRAPAHPYTRGLLRCVPVLVGAGRQRGERYEAIAGALEDLSVRRRGGCAFAPRCPDRFDPCEASVPDLYAAGEGRSRCFLSREAAGRGA
jgi:oligopeptide/dipeptide ABC transporter ATP-binding protein